MPNLSEKLSGLTFTPKAQSPMRAGCIVNVASDSVAEWTSRNWLECDGSEYPESTYADLFAAIGTKYNTGGETASHFRVPNGPRKTVDVDLGNFLAFSSTNFSKGYVFQDALGDYFLDIGVAGTTGSSVSLVDLDFSSLGVSFEAPANGSPVLAGSYNTGGSSARVQNSTTLRTVTASSLQNHAVGGIVRLTGKPTDAFVSNDSRFSTFDEALEAIPVIKIYNDEGTVSVSSAAATASTLGTVKLNSEYAATSSQYGLVKANSIIEKLQDTAYSGSGATGILPLTNIPDGKYKLTVGCQYAYRSVSNAIAQIRPQLNSANVPNGAGGSWFIGVDDDGSVETEAYNRGYSGTRLLTFSNGTNTIDLDIDVTASGILARPWYILEKLENVTEITTEWD